MSFTVTVAAQTIAAPETLGNPSKGASVLVANEGLVVIEYQRPRAAKRDQIMVPRAQVLSLNHGTASADSGYVIAQGLAGEADSFEAVEIVGVEGNVATFKTEDGALIETDARLTRVQHWDVEANGSLAGEKKKAKPAGKKK